MLRVIIVGHSVMVMPIMARPQIKHAVHVVEAQEDQDPLSLHLDLPEQIHAHQVRCFSRWK